MRTPLNLIACLLGAMLLTLAPSQAHGEVVYFLVGVRHVYRIGPNRDAHLQEREEIEKNYADGVAEDQDTFNQHVANGADRDKESSLMNDDLNALADARDKSLGSIFEQCDFMRDEHPELRIQGDGPYQVIGVEMHEEGDAEVIDRYCVYAPWPGYVCDGPYYGGWDWGVWYTPGVFIDLYWGWYGGWPGGRFWGGFWGHHGPVVFAPHGFVDRWHGGKAYGGFGRSAGGYVHSRWGDPRATGYTGHTYARSASGYSHSSVGGYARSTSTYRSAGSSASRGWGYTHSESRSGTSGYRSFAGSSYGGGSHAGGYEFSSHGSSYGSSSRGQSYGGGARYGGGRSTESARGGGSAGRGSGSRGRSR